jgi:hypothetical protein
MSAESNVKIEDQAELDCRQRFAVGMDGELRTPEGVLHPDSVGSFEIVAITAGEANGWTFPAAVLQQSVPLWNGIECFLDHNFNAGGGRSVRDLAGLIHSPDWDPTRQGIKTVLKPVGPGGQVLAELGKEMLAGELRVPEPASGSSRSGEGAHPLVPKIGFSADISFTKKEKEVVKIIKVWSVDLVIDPARGGQFIRSLNQKLNSEVSPMEEKTNVQSPPPAETQKPLTPIETQIATDHQAVRDLLGEHQRQQILEAEADKARVVRIQMCGYLLDTALSASHLPQPVTDRIRSQFQNVVFEPAALQSTIEDYRKMVSELTATAVVQGPGRFIAMYDTRDKLQAAADDLLGAPRDEKMKGVQVHRLTGIRELYLMLTGDDDMHGGFYPDRVRLATTADFTGLVKNALNKLVVNTWEELGRAGYDWWTNIVTTEHFSSLNTITGTLVGTVGDLPVVAEGAEYTELAVGDSPETASFVKYGGYIPLTLELIDRDQTRKLSAYAREMASAGLRKVSKLVSAIFTDNSSTGPVLADTGALFNATALATKGGHLNLLTVALSQAQWEVVSAVVYNQPMLTKLDTGYYGVGPKMAINPKYLLVPRALQLAARQICYGDYVPITNQFMDNLYKGLAVPLTVPEWTDVTDWAAVCDPKLAPSIYVGERFGLMPEVFVQGDELQGAVFTNDEHRLKVRHFLAVWVNDFRPLHKENVSG